MPANVSPRRRGSDMKMPIGLILGSAVAVLSLWPSGAHAQSECEAKCNKAYKGMAWYIKQCIAKQCGAANLGAAGAAGAAAAGAAEGSKAARVGQDARGRPPRGPGTATDRGGGSFKQVIEGKYQTIKRLRDSVESRLVACNQASERAEESERSALNQSINKLRSLSHKVSDACHEAARLASGAAGTYGDVVQRAKLKEMDGYSTTASQAAADASRVECN
jgi:hypothetical protein